VIPTDEAGPALCQRLSEIPGCDVVLAEKGDLILLVTETGTAEEEDALRNVLEGLDEIRALLLVFGEVASEDLPSVGPASVGNAYRPPSTLSDPTVVSSDEFGTDTERRDAS
jgi:nitrate reductase NapAB chaperone NapD